MAVSVNLSDPRVRRTRQLLLDAFMELVGERNSIYTITVQDITERAEVNRSTFYAHFEDKYALLESWMRAKFNRSLATALAGASSLTYENLQTLVGAVFVFLARFRSFQRQVDKQYEPLFEVCLQQELYEVLLGWLKEVTPGLPGVTATPLSHRSVTVETTAMVSGWAILGPAIQWSRGDQEYPAEEMAGQVMAVVVAALSPLVELKALAQLSS